MRLVRSGGDWLVMLTIGASISGVVASACSGPTPESLARADAAIIGGSRDTTSKGVVSVLSVGPDAYYLDCSGTLITQNLVLTAQHCVAPLDSPDALNVDCGKTRFLDPEPPSTKEVSVEADIREMSMRPYRVAEVWVPEQRSEVCGKDIALLLLSGAGVAASVATPIEPGLAAEVRELDDFSAIGYGVQDPTDEQGTSAGYRMRTNRGRVTCAGVSCDMADALPSEWVGKSPICAGDSGGPALDRDGRVVGVALRGNSACSTGVYSSVYAWKAFIIDGVFGAAEAGHYPPPTWAGVPPPGLDPGVGGSSADDGSTGTGDGGDAPLLPVVDPLGQACTGTCPGAYKCWAETGNPPGICVPACSEAAALCPTDFTCSTELQACVKSSPPEGGAALDSSGCSVAAAGHGTNASPWLEAVALMLGVAVAFCKERRERLRPG